MRADDILKQIAELIVQGNDEEIKMITKKALDSGLYPYHIIDNGLNIGMETISQQYDKGEVALPELIMAGEAFHASINIIKAVFKKEGRKSAGKVVIGTVQYDVHTLGMEIVATMLEVAGFECLVLGADVPASEFVKKVTEVNADIIGASALMTTTMPQQKEVINALKKAGIRDKVKVMVGGAPVSQAWADKIGADGYAKDAIEAPELAKRLMGR